MNSYFFYYFKEVGSSTPFFEVVNCKDDGHAVSRCKQLLQMRDAHYAEVWLGERPVERLFSDDKSCATAAKLAANPPQALASLHP